MDGPHTQRQQVLSHHLRYSKTGCLIAAVLIAMGSGLDHFAYPERFKEFLELRWIAIFALLGVWVLLLLRPCEVLSGVANATILEVAHNSLGILFQHRHVIVGRFTQFGLGSHRYALAHFLF